MGMGIAKPLGFGGQRFMGSELGRRAYGGREIQDATFYGRCSVIFGNPPWTSLPGASLAHLSHPVRKGVYVKYSVKAPT